MNSLHVMSSESAYEDADTRRAPACIFYILREREYNCLYVKKDRNYFLSQNGGGSIPRDLRYT